MPKRDPRLMRQLGEALRSKDTQSMQVACALFPTVDEGAQAAQYLLEKKMPSDIRAWWSEDACDLPDDPKSVLNEAAQLFARIHLERERMDQGGG